MRRADFLKRMAFAALACGFLDLSEIAVTSTPNADLYGMTGLRESLSDVIYNISPVDTPFVHAVRTEWHTVDLRP